MPTQKIGYLDGPRLRRGVLAAADHLIRHGRHLDAINVFPVPDADTGTNMAQTMRAVAEQLAEARSRAAGAVSSAVAESALMGARGNSGAILAQFFNGLAESIGERRRVSAARFAEAAETASAWARQAISKPEEGTILSVIGAWAEAVREHADRSPDLADVLQSALDRAQAALKRTPEQMAALREAGVVDAGAQGFVYLLEGVQALVRGEWAALGLDGPAIEELDFSEIGDEDAPVHAAHVDGVGSAYGYCIECMLTPGADGAALDRAALRDGLEALGDSVVVAGHDRRARLHVHADDPAAVFELAAGFGAVTGQKADDMRLQQADTAAAERGVQVGIVADTGADLPEDVLRDLRIHRVPLRLYFGEESHADRVTLSIESYYRRLQDPAAPHPKTSQPAPADFERVYRLVSRHYPRALSIHVPGKHSGTLSAATRAAAAVSERIETFDGRDAGIGLGLVVLAAARAADAGASLEEVRAVAERAARDVRLFIAMETVDYLVRGGRLSRFKGFMAGLLGMTPVLTFDAEGTATPVAKARSAEAGRREVLRLATEAAEGRPAPMFAVSHVAASEAAEALAAELRRRFDPETLHIVEASPTLGAHVGPGATGIAVL